MSFDRYLSGIRFAGEVVTENIINNWLTTYDVPEASLAGYIKTIRVFMKYRSSLGRMVYMPPYRKVIDTYIPYIFTVDEVKQICEASDNLVTFMPNLALIHIYEMFPMIVRLLYGCGTRLGETIQLKINDIDIERGILTLRHAKADKERLIPLHSSLHNVLRKYCMSLGFIGLRDTYIFPGKNPNSHISPSTVERIFKSVLQNIGIIFEVGNPRKRGPCLHCLRHSFILESFKQLKESGYPFDYSVPYLSIYCGHKSLLETEKYMKFSSEMFPDDMHRFEDFTKDIFPEVEL
jgi:integrase